MALEFARFAAFVRASLATLTARGRQEESPASSSSEERPFGSCGYDTRERRSVGVLSEEAEAALAPLDLPPDGPIDPKSALRAKLMPDVAAGNFVCWAQALGLIGNYSKRSIYALYCEFSEVDQRPPIGEERFLEALKQTEYVRVERLRIACGNGKFRRPWQWTIELAPEIRAFEFGDEAPGASVELHRLGETASTRAEAPAPSAPVTRPIRPLIIRYVPDEGHPFSPAGLREKAKSARRLRLNTAASRKQRGALRRAA